MGWIPAARRRRWTATLMFTLLLCSKQSLATSLECIVAPSTGQPACDISLDAGSSVPDSARSEHVGNPIDVVSGNKYQSEIDTRLRGSHLELVRHYNSFRTAENLGLGNGWRHTYSLLLSTNGDDSRQIMQSDGRVVHFSREGRLFRAANESDGYITTVADNRHVWHMPDGRQLSFYGSFLTSISFADGGHLSLYYQSGRLASVTDEVGRALRFHYAAGKPGLPSYELAHGHTPAGHLESVELPDGNRLRYRYSSRQNLVSVEYPTGVRRNLGRHYQYEDSRNPALLTERSDGLRRVLARWSYDDYGRAISYTRGSHIRAKGSRGGRPTLTLSYAVDDLQNTGKTRVTYRKGDVHSYQWQLDERGRVLEISKSGPVVPSIRESHNGSDDGSDEESASAKQSSLAGNADFVQHYPHDVLTVLAVDALGYPSRIQYTLARDGSTHLLDSVHDQVGRLVDVTWQSGTLNAFDHGQPVTREDVRRLVEDSRASGENQQVALSALARMGQIAGMAAEFLEAAPVELGVGSTITGEELDEARRLGALGLPAQGMPRGYKSSDETDGETDPSCVDPLTDCESLLRTRDYAEVAECAYIDASCNTRFGEADLGGLNLEIGDLHEGSFHAEIFHDRENDEYIVSFAGTDFTSTSDWVNNLAQEFGFSSFQYTKAVELARQLIENTPGANFTFVGHSLGGGLATAAAAAVGRNATVFNPAALDVGSAERMAIDYENAQADTQIYSVAGELLSNVQTEIGFSNEPPGIVNVLRRPEFSWIQSNLSQNPYMLYETRLGVVLHGMGAVRQSLAEAIERNQCS